MRLSLAGAAISLLSYSAGVAAQTFSDCNPLQKTCPPVPALGRTANYDFTQGASGDFKDVGTVKYDSEGASFTIAKQGDAPLIQSKWYIMFGRVECVIKTAPGTGIVSSAVLQSDDLDEIDWEWLGINNLYVQTNYFGKGNTGSYNRGAVHDNKGNHDDYHTYTIEWTSEQIVWQIDGQTVRAITPQDAGDQYPQSPMMVKVGAWAGGDPNNAPGTIQWAGGETDYSAGPFTMSLQSLEVTDYSTGTSYSYGDKSGTWQSIIAEGGQVEGNDGAEPQSTQSAPPVTSTVQNIPIPWSGTHRETSSFVTPSIWPWVPTPTASSTAMTSLPSGWTFSGSGSVQPPSASSLALEKSTAQSTSASSVSSPERPSPSGSKTETPSSIVTATTSSTSSTTSSTMSTSTTGSGSFTHSPSSRTKTSHSTSFTSSPKTTSGPTATLTATTGEPSFTGVAHVAPTVAASSHTVKISVMGVVCALSGIVFTML